MNLRSNESKAKDNLWMIERFTEQYLAKGLTDKEYKKSCFEEIQEIIDRDSESEGSMAWSSWLLTKVYERYTKWSRIVQNLYSRK